MHPIRLTLTLIISLLIGSLFLLFSIPRYYAQVFSLDAAAVLKIFSQYPVSEPGLNSTQPLLIGVLVGCSISIVLYNLIRFLYTGYRSNLSFGLALSFLLLFLFLSTELLTAQTPFLLNLDSDFIYVSVILSMLFLHSLCLSLNLPSTLFNKLSKQLIRHMGVLCLGGIALLTLSTSYAHTLTYYLLITSSVMLLGSSLRLWHSDYPPARTLFIGFSTFCLPLLAAWPALSNESLFSADNAVVLTLASLVVSAIIISIGLSEAHRQQIKKNTQVSNLHAAEQAESRAKSELLAKISHEIRTPLSGVLGMTTLLLDTPLSSKQRDYAQTIQSSGNELLSLINEILDITRLESKQITLSHTPFNLAGLLQECTQAFSNNASEQGVELTVFFQPQIPEILLGDPVRLRQVLLSILNNAFKRTAQGEITLSAAVEQGAGQPQLLFNLQDTGTPLSDEERHILSSAQLHSKDLLSASFIGGNLGIIIARQLISLMGGVFSIQSSTHGCSFIFSIPLQAQPSQAVHLEADSILRQKHILLIDSHALSQKVLAQQCSEWGLRVSTSTSATDAVALLRNKALQGQHFAAILISETIHKPSAITFAVRIKADPLLKADASLIMLTSSSNTDPIATRNAGISHVLMKPVSASTLKATLINAVQNTSASLSTHPAQASAKHVLIAEDDAISVKVISGLLSKLGARFDVVANGQLALDKLRKNHYDLVLMDCEMPVMDGFTAAQQQRAYEAAQGLPAVTIIALSAHVLDEHQLRAKQSGMDGHLAKPIELGKLQAILEKS